MRYLPKPTRDNSAGWGFSQRARDKQNLLADSRYCKSEKMPQQTVTTKPAEVQSALKIFRLFYSIKFFNILTSLGRNSALGSAPVNCRNAIPSFRGLQPEGCLEFNHQLIGCHYDVIGGRSLNKSTYSIKSLVQQKWSKRTQNMLSSLPSAALQPVFEPKKHLRTP